ncbi:GatB/YqeY domain-containing protein [Tepidamorphus sp. 3E244]|uniref:GatB/YqeY domain-containing protein n=1 Tax=Tepidamorphus sp. 3E244 TaxID=3385498 RepID=UPI0038FC1DF8
MRQEINDSLKTAMREQDRRRMATLRLINAAIKDRDIAVRSTGKDDLVSDDDIRQILQKMIKQREESAKIYEEAGRIELVEQETQESEIIRSFLPRQLSEDEIRSACVDVVEDLEGTCVRDMGKCMNALKERYPGQMDFGRASGVVKDLLCSRSAVQG